MFSCVAYLIIIYSGMLTTCIYNIYIYIVTRVSTTQELNQELNQDVKIENDNV